MALSLCFGVHAAPIDLQWIGDAPEIPAGVSWGVPFKKGEIKSKQQFTLTDADGNQLPLQSWVMASFGDGSVKWMGFSASVMPEQTQGLKVDLIKKATPVQGLRAEERDGEIVVNNGIGEFVFGKYGRDLIKSVSVNGTVVAENGRLVCMLEDRSQADAGVLKFPGFTSNIEKVTLEQAGPVRAVVRFEGKHKADEGSREWLPFVVRLYVYHNVEAVKMVHSIIYDGEQSEDYIKGLGVVFDVPLREEMHNRHVRFSGEGEGLWSEPIQPLSGRRNIAYPRAAQQEGAQQQRPRQDMRSPYTDQVAGMRIPNKEEFDRQGQFLLDNWAVWSDFRLTQLSPDGFTIRKRTNDQSTWIGTAGSNRASGLVLAGDVSGGLAVSLKNFWQSCPAELEVTDMNSDRAQLKVWMWSPRGEAMDLRHYDIIGHDLEAAYEDYQEGMSTPYGIGRTSELTLYPFSSLPSKQQTVGMAKAGQQATQLMASPEYLHSAGAFGVWSLPDTSHPTKKWLEEQIDGYLSYYQKSIEQHKWYGFWNYGDVMHSYNRGRHMWNYDIGGNAWANTELSPDLWLWYTFVRTGREDIFRMATAMTRHTSEVDMYHIGEMAGLGTRHNVSHWGCGAKEARIGQAWWKRFYYYLTTDDRMGDLMHEAADADFQMLKWDPLRVAQPRDQFPTAQPTRLRWGPDWIAFVGNWFTEWERTGNKKYLDKIKLGMDTLGSLPNGLFTGRGPYGYDPETGRITYEGDPDWVNNRNHLANLMGGFEVMMEVYPEIDHKKFKRTYLLYSKFYNLPEDDPIRDLPENKEYYRWFGHWNMPRLGAFAASEMKDDYLAGVMWYRFLSGSVGQDGKFRDMTATTEISTPDVLYPIEENAGIGTNGTAQWNLNAVIMLELIGDSVPSPEELAAKVAAERRRAAELREQRWGGQAPQPQ